jgi:hypothetical protein
MSSQELIEPFAVGDRVTYRRGASGAIFFGTIIRVMPKAIRVRFCQTVTEVRGATFLYKGNFQEVSTDSRLETKLMTFRWLPSRGVFGIASKNRRCTHTITKYDPDGYSVD